MKTPIIILHGWGKSGSDYKAIQKIFEENGYKVFSPDFPGFGNNKQNKDELVFDDYVLFVSNFLKKHEFKKVILIGHSFGGRVAIRFTALYPQLIKQLVLTGASGIPRQLPSVKKKIVFFATKVTKPLFALPPLSFFYSYFRKLVYYSIGEMDYYKSGNLAKTFKNVYKVSIVDDLENINIPTLILWGEIDKITPLVDAQYMYQRVSHSKLVVVPTASHKLPYENPELFADEVLKFIK